jgi:hypothetical protein
MIILVKKWKHIYRISNVIFNKIFRITGGDILSICDEEFYLRNSCLPLIWERENKITEKYQLKIIKLLKEINHES